MGKHINIYHVDDHVYRSWNKKDNQCYAFKLEIPKGTSVSVNRIFGLICLFPNSINTNI